MERLRLTLATLMCIVFLNQKSKSGTEVEMRVRRGDNVTFYCDCNMSSGAATAWFRNCSHDHQPSLIIQKKNENYQRFPRFHLVHNSSSQSHDLVVEKITEKDLGLYYCAKHDTKFVVIEGSSSTEDIFHYGTLITRLSLVETTTSTLPVPVCSWMLLVTVCAVCVLLSSLLSSACVYYHCHNKSTDVGVDQQGSERTRDELQAEDDLHYTTVNFSNKQKDPKKKRVQNLNFPVYSEVRTDRM